VGISALSQEEQRVSISATKLTIEAPAREAARVYLADKAYDSMVGHEEAAKTGEVLREIGLEDITLRMIRQTLASNARFEAIERKWTLSTRFQDKQQTFERILESVISGCGRPMPFETLTQELAIVCDRPVSYYEQMLPRMLSSHEKFFVIDSDAYGLTSWLLVAQSESPEDVLFDNFMEESDIKPYRKAAGKIKWDAGDIPDSAAKLAIEVGHKVPIRVVAFFAWEALGSSYDAIGFYTEIIQSDKLVALSTQEVFAAEQKPEVMKALAEIEAELEELPAETEEEAVEAGPVAVSEADRDEIVTLILNQGGTVSAEEILESVLEISPGERGYDTALESLNEALKEEDRLIRVGQGRWRPAGTLPEGIYDIPTVLIMTPNLPFETPEGDIYDQELEDDGLEAGLKQEIMNPLVQDIGDEDPGETAYQPLDSYQRGVLKYHHKETGTMPLIQFNPGFFGDEPDVIQITLIHESVRREAWINNKTRLIYGMKDWYTADMPVSGAAFEIHRTERPGEYRFIYDNRTDPLVFVPTSRLLELLALKDEAESHEMPLFDIITHILEHYRKGIGFVSLFTEVNLVRRASRRLVASILSSYHCFHTRGKTGEWQYDAKKRSQGFNKAKRKYIKK
jgi:hypothetical protein